ncbi:uncharacterized protein LOC143149496 [Ptiloglossa arizonensis]|uniref:uncharacterized protein LOC143149496 n=1 Tax=Ptiloglossa arizonensis TaxID=3350558 RepID=UPI003F9FB931
MEKDMGFASGSAPPIPPPSAPPSYEQALGNMANLPPQMNVPPYPVQQFTMPVPPYNPPSSQTTTSPYPPNYSDPGEPPLQTQMQYNAVPNFPPTTEVRVIHQPVTYVLGPKSVKITCPTCHASIKTTTISDHQPIAHICCIIFCLLGCCLCSCLPYCLDSFTRRHHFCPNCKNYIGTWKG